MIQRCGPEDLLTVKGVAEATGASHATARRVLHQLHPEGALTTPEPAPAQPEPGPYCLFGLVLCNGPGHEDHATGASTTFINRSARRRCREPQRRIVADSPR